ncbi:MAG: hypothetical protein ACE5QF_02865 [Thermoplasmata archaeon]
MPFAFLGILLLLTSSLSMAYIAGLQSESVRNRIIEDVVQRGSELSALVHNEVQTEAYWIGTRAVQLGCGNQSRIASLYDQMMNSYLIQSFPRRVKGFLIEISNHSSSIILESRMLNDFERGARVENDTFGNSTFEEVETAYSGYWMELQRTMTFSVAGHITYTIAGNKIITNNTHHFSLDLDSLVPFLNGRMEKLATDSVSEFGDIARMLRYMLSTLAQVRVLEGWGGSQEMPSTDRILTQKDVEKALNLALLLEHMALFRSLGEDEIRKFDFHDPDGVSDSDFELLRRMWPERGTLDPSDLLLLHRGEKDATISIGGMASQAIFAMIDQMTLRYFDYFGLSPISDLSLQAAQALSSSIQEFLDWVSGMDREAWLARSWFKEIATESGTTTLASRPFMFRVPELEFLLATEKQGLVNFSLPEFDVYIPFKTVDVAENFDDFWRSCFQLVYSRDLRSVHESQRQLIREMAARVGELAQDGGAFSEVSLRDIDPSDDVSVLRILSEAVSINTATFLTKLRGNDTFVNEMIGNLWSQQANLTENVVTQIVKELGTFTDDEGPEKANKTISQQLLSMVRNETSYGLLTEEEKVRLGQEIEEFVREGELGIKAHELMLNETRTRLTAMKDRVISLETPSQNGGIYSKLREFVTSSSGVLADAARAISRLTESIVESEDVENIRFLVSATRESFRFWDGSSKPGVEGTFERNFTLDVSRQPLSLTGEAWQDGSTDENLGVGDLRIGVMTPMDFPAGSGKNTHYTDITSSSATPFSSTWKVRIRGLTEVYIAANGEPAELTNRMDSMRKHVPIEFEVVITTKSGWPLDGVVYDSSNTFLDDVWTVIRQFLEVVWNHLVKVYDWILDSISKILSLVSRLIGTLLSYAQDVLRAIESVVEATVELLRSSISGVTGIVGGIVENIISAFGNMTFQISAFGGDLRISLNQGNGAIVRGDLELGCLEAVLLLNKLTESNLTHEKEEGLPLKYDAIVLFNVTTEQLSLRGRFDPAMTFENSFFKAEMEWGDGWIIDFEVPYVQKYFEEKFSLQIPSIPTPMGTVDIEMGFLLKLTERLEKIDVFQILSRSFDLAWGETLGKEISIGSAARFIEQGISNAVNDIAFAVERNLDKVIEVILYLEGQFKVGATAGIGIRLAFILSGGGLSQCFRWLAGRLRNIISDLGTPPSVNIDGDLSKVLASETFVGFEILFSLGMPRIVKMMSGASGSEIEALFVVSVRINMATFGLLLGSDFGQSRIGFGIYLEDVPPSFIGEQARKGEQIDIWLLRGEAVQLR